MTRTLNIEKERILAGIVLYMPDPSQLRKNIQALINQCSEIILVDNSPEDNPQIRLLCQEFNLLRLENHANLGIAKALNQILEYARDHKYKWYLTMDQDSLPAGNLVSVMLEQAKSDTGILCPFLLNNRKISMEEYQSMQLPEREIITDPIDCITSASLNRTQAALEIGGYWEELFIDCVDVDFNIRMMEAGWQIVRCPHTWLIQEMGEGKRVGWMETLYRLTGNKVFQRLSVTPVYNFMRLYYVARNSRLMYHFYKENSGRSMKPHFMVGQFLYYSLTYPASISRIKMWKAIIKGWRDAAKMEAK